MQIILVHQRWSQARTLTFTFKHLLLTTTTLALMIIACAWGLSGMGLRLGDKPLMSNPFAASAASTSSDAERKDKNTRDNINAMAIKLGELQAQLMRLDALGDRVSGLAGLPQQEVSNFKLPTSRGGVESGPQFSPPRDLGLNELQNQLTGLADGLERRSDSFNDIETELMSAKLKSKMMPTIQPVDVAYNSSGFGWRIDPFTGQQARHEGIDFVAQTGTPIVAAAGGVVIVSEWHHDFGNMVEIDHGNDITTLYAHASRIYVKVGDIVHRNQHIADVGSTGHATGSHLHFEVHVKGIPQNPAKFLAYGNATVREQVAAANGTSLPTRH